ncbi:MFS general substrate transporter [Pseudovirgaria hyperparasitica]|uniref:MFS general substrate transporter n=1 Tax=Pseudovirgaria hyperparasitica TaxID=470096 RepID=A0A6A6W349_9PEZI|nr:MFS general substrate transporter [Pseudovirgaria hyperparasitica]KAF2756444.1 MFS general substrate transporter [Pseudovirgaria hyperparasitica]
MERSSEKPLGSLTTLRGDVQCPGSTNESTPASEYPRRATQDEIRDLPHDIGAVPITAWLLCFTSAASRLAWYGVTVPWQNYLQNARGDELVPGALGLGQAKSTIIQNTFLFFQYLTPLPFAILSDAFLGRYRVMVISLGLLLGGYTVMFATSLPDALEAGAGVGGLVATMLLIGLGQGGLSAVMYPFIGDQVPEEKPMVTLKKGRLVVIDRKTTIQYVFNVYYWMVNITTLAGIIPSTFLEKHIDFWAAYLMPTCILALSVVPVLLWNKSLMKTEPKGNVMTKVFHIFAIAIRNNFRLSAASPAHFQHHDDETVPWTDKFIDEIRRGLKACRVIICFVIFWLCYNQATNNIISQAGQMKTHGVSNDTINALNPVACIILGPLIQNVLFPFLRHRKVRFGPILRIVVAFLFTAAAIAYAAGLQKLIYSAEPCFDHPLACTMENGSGSAQPGPNQVNVWLQTPLYFLLGIGEILGLVSLSEYAYAEAPTDMKALVQAFQQLTAAIGAALGIALGPVSKDPWLVVMYACLAGVMGLCGGLFWLVFRRLDDDWENEDDGSPENAERTES